MKTKIKEVVTSHAIDLVPILAVFGIMGLTTFLVSKSIQKLGDVSLDFKESDWFK